MNSPVSEVEFVCDCGEKLSLDPERERVRCGCGSVYLVTLTQLSGPAARAD